MSNSIAAPVRSRVRTAALSDWKPAVAWLLVVAAGAVIGERLYDRDPLIRIGAAPLVGSPDVRLSLTLLPAVAIGAWGIWRGHAVAQRLRWPLLLAATWVGSATWAVALAIGGGAHA